MVASSVAVAAAPYLGVDLTYIHSHFLQLATATFLLSFLLSVYLYVRSRYVPADQLALGGNSGKEEAGKVCECWGKPNRSVRGARFNTCY